MIWVLTDIPGYETCDRCGAVVYTKGEGLRIHQKWHANLFAAVVAIADALPE